MTKDERVKAIEGIISGVVGELLSSRENEYDYYSCVTKPVSIAIEEAIVVDEEKTRLLLCYIHPPKEDFGESNEKFTEMWREGCLKISIAKAISNNKDIIKIE